MHYVSTLSTSCQTVNDDQSLNDMLESNATSSDFCQNVYKRKASNNKLGYTNKGKNMKSKSTIVEESTSDSCVDKKAKNARYMRKYRACKSLHEHVSHQKERERKYKQSYRKRVSSEEQRPKANAYMKNYRASKASKEQRTKVNAYMKSYRAKKSNIEYYICKFHELVSQGPVYICTCCDQLWYKHTVLKTDKLRKQNPDIHKYLIGKRSVSDIEWVCKTCHQHLNKNKVPPCALANGMGFPSKPAFFDLNELECRLLAPRIAFLKLMQAPRGKQLKIHGNIVNVPADVGNSVSLLPRLPYETATIKVNLKRRLQYKSNALSLTVRPNKVVEAAIWLINNSDLYKEEGIELNDNWLNSFNEDLVLHSEDKNEENLPLNDTELNNEESALDENSSNDKDDWTEEEAEIPAGVTDTLLTPPDFVDDSERQCILNLAPAEGNRPLSIFRDEYSEELAYPGIFLGKKRPDHNQRMVKVHYSDICKSELRMSDRRAAMNVENILYC